MEGGPTLRTHSMQDGIKSSLSMAIMSRVLTSKTLIAWSVDMLASRDES